MSLVLTNIISICNMLCKLGILNESLNSLTSSLTVLLVKPGLLTGTLNRIIISFTIFDYAFDFLKVSFRNLFI